jgi:hypothetical protein
MKLNSLIWEKKEIVFEIIQGSIFKKEGAIAADISSIMKNGERKS